MDKIRRTKIITGIIMVLTGLGIISYPFVSNYLAGKNASVAVQEYQEQVKELDEKQVDAIKEAATAYNEQLNTVSDQNAAGVGKAYDSYKDLVGVGSALGYISIPRIDIKLPIFEGTNDDVLAKGIGHLVETSYPIGGEGTHCVLSGHRGMAEAELFTNLDKMEVGNEFYLHILDEVLAYEVDQIKIVLPEDISDLQIIPGEDFCTLVTCTPIGINSHRLLVRGRRVPYHGEEDGSDSIYQSVHRGTAMQRLVKIWPWLALAMILVLGVELLIGMTIVRRMRERMEED